MGLARLVRGIVRAAGTSTASREPVRIILSGCKRIGADACRQGTRTTASKQDFNTETTENHGACTEKESIGRFARNMITHRAKRHIFLLLRACSVVLRLSLIHI